MEGAAGNALPWGAERGKVQVVPGHTLRAAAPVHEELKFIICSLDDPGLLDWF